MVAGVGEGLCEEENRREGLRRLEVLTQAWQDWEARQGRWRLSQLQVQYAPLGAPERRPGPIPPPRAAVSECGVARNVPCRGGEDLGKVGFRPRLVPKRVWRSCDFPSPRPRECVRLLVHCAHGHFNKGYDCFLGSGG